MDDQVVAPGRKYSKKDFAAAAEDARTVVADSATIRALLSSMVLARRLYMVMRTVLDHELTQEWEVENPGLVIQTLVMSAQEKANDKFALRELFFDLCEGVIPAAGILAWQEMHDGKEILSGGAETGEAQLPGVLHGAAAGEQPGESGADPEGPGEERVQAP